MTQGSFTKSFLKILIVWNNFVRHSAIYCIFLYLYQLALEGRGFTISSLRYVYVLDRQEREVELLEDEKKDTFLAKMAERMDAILTSNFEATPEPFVCKYCDFRQVCPFRKLS